MKLLSFFIFIFILLLNKVESQYSIHSIQNLGVSLYIYVNNVEAAIPYNIYINDYEISSYCTFYLGGTRGYLCTNLPVVDQIKSGTIKVVVNGITVTKDYSFAPVITKVTYITLPYRVPTIGGDVILTGRYFDLNKFDGSSNDFQVIYRRDLLPSSSYTITNSTSLNLKIPDGTGYTPGKIENPLYIRTATNTTDTPKDILYEPPAISKITYNEATNYFTVDGTNFGAYQQLVKIFGCGRVITTNIQLTVAHYQVLAYYDLELFNYLSCTNIQMNINNQNSSSATLTIPSHITSVSTPPALGGQITIKGSFLSDMSASGVNVYWRVYMNGVSFTNVQCPSINGSVLVCNSPARASNSKLSVYLEVGFGKYTETIDVNYILQQLYSVTKLVYGQAGLVTIKGDGFFNSGSISVTIGGKQCTNPEFIDSTTITCTFSADVAPSSNGLRVSVSTINGVSVGDLFYYYSESFSSVTQQDDTLILVGDSFTSSLTISVGSIDITDYCIVNSTTLISCYNVPSIPSGDVKISGGSTSTLPFVFTPVIQSISNSLFSTSGETIDIIGKYFELKVNQAQQQTLSILIDDGIKSFTDFTLKSSTEIQFKIPPGSGSSHSLSLLQTSLESTSVLFSYIAPKINSFTQQSTNVTIYGTNFGSDLSLIKITIGSTVLNTKSILVPHTTINVIIPWTLENGQLIVQVNDQQDSTLFKLIPTLVSIDSPPVIGGFVNVVGSFISNQNSSGNNVNVVLATGTPDQIVVITPACTLIDTPSSTNNYIYSCEIASGSGSFNSFIYYDGQVSNSISVSYQSPSIISSSATVYGKSSLITIHGSNFATPVSVLIQDSNGNSLECTNPTVLSSTNITCQFASTLPKPPTNENQYFNVIVNVNGLVSSNRVFRYFEEIFIKQVLQNKNSITIIGNGYSSDIGSTQIFISTQDLTLECNIYNDTNITCSSLPLYILSGTIVVSNKFTKSNSYQFYFTPYIISLGTPIMDTAGNQVITLTGRFFESINPITNQDNNFKLLSDGITPLLITQMDGTTIIAKSISGFGKDHYLVVSQNNNIMSNKVQYSYTAPIISNLIQINDYQFSINAQHFSSNNLSLNSIIINDSPSIITPSIVSNNDNILIFSIQDGKESNGQISLNVDGQNSNYLSIYFKPVIKSLSLKPYLDGSSVVTINGQFFSNINYQSKNKINLLFNYKLDGDVDINVLECNYINGESVECKGFIGYGSATLTLTKTDDSIELVSNSLQFTFQSPIVIKSTSLYYQVAGNITITVESFTFDGLQVYVEDVPCISPEILDNRHIICYYDSSVPPNQDQSSLEISVISNNMIGKNQVFYYYDSLNCPNNCTSLNQGICNPTNGECKCNSNWEGLDCNIEKQTSLPPPQVDNNGETTLNGGNLNFTVSIVYLREMDINGNQVKTISMNSINWVNRTKVSSTESYYKGVFDNETVIVELDVTFYNNSIDYDFAGDIISIPSNSIKYIITISNYQFNSPLNTFQVIYNSKAKKYYNDGCKFIETSSNSGSGLNITESISWFQIVSGSSVMDAKFSRRMFIDDKVRKSDVSILDLDDPLYLLINSTGNDNKDDQYYNRFTSINTPSFKNNIVLDPSFNSLIRTSNDQDSCKENKWKIPVIASLCAVGGAALIIALSGLFYKKYKNKLLERSLSNKMKSFN